MIDRITLRGLGWKGIKETVQNRILKGKSKNPGENCTNFINLVLNQIIEKVDSTEKFSRFPNEFIAYSVVLSEAVTSTDNTSSLTQFFPQIQKLFDDIFKKKKYHCIPGCLLIATRFISAGSFSFSDFRVHELLKMIPSILESTNESDYFIILSFLTGFLSTIADDLFADDSKNELLLLIEPLLNILYKITNIQSLEPIPLIYKIDDNYLKNIPILDNDKLWSGEENGGDDEMEDCAPFPQYHLLEDNNDSKLALCWISVGIVFQILYEDENIVDEIDQYIDYKISNIKFNVNYDNILLSKEIYIKYAQLSHKLFEDISKLNKEFKFNIMDAVSCVLMNCARILYEKYDDELYYNLSVKLFPIIMNNINLNETGSVGLLESFYSAYQILIYVSKQLLTDEEFIPYYEQSVKILENLRLQQKERINTSDLLLILTRITDCTSLFIRKCILTDNTIKIILNSSNNVFGSRYLYSDILFISNKINALSSEIIPIILEEFKNLEEFDDPTLEIKINAYIRIIYVLGDIILPHFTYIYNTMRLIYFDASFFLALITAISRPPIQRDVISYVVNEDICNDHSDDINEIFGNIIEVLNGESNDVIFEMVGKALIALKWYFSWKEYHTISVYQKNNIILIDALLDYVSQPLYTSEDGDILSLVIEVLISIYKLSNTPITYKNKIKNQLINENNYDDDEEMMLLREEIYNDYLDQLD